jgi:hypothetical protein
VAQINRVKLTQAQYARWRKEHGLPGSSREAVRKAVDEGRISVDNDGQIDSEVADIQWAKNTRARVSPQATATDAAVAGADLVSQAAAPASAQATPPPPTPTPAPSNGYTEARARREIAEAEQAEIELRKMRGDIVMSEDVARAGFEAGRDLRDAAEAAENGLAAELAALSSADACRDVLRRHHRALFDALARSWREKMGQRLQEAAA